MEHTFLNLNEGSFPIRINKKFKELDGLENLGQLKDQIVLNLTIEKLSNELFLARGNIEVTLEAKCQTCFKKTSIKLNLTTNVGIKDNKFENIDKKAPLEIHYQDLEKFNINDLISEEIYLNFPSIVTCCNIGSNEEQREKSPDKIRPFQKIRDLIK
tara:strand:- start:4 stop:474 length:471 start_codon:yes stop_codon:yes gene_type:complete